jgi:hypothetical protein
MKKIALVCIALLGLVAAPASAVEWAAPNQLSAEAGLDLGGWGVGAGAGIEYGITRLDLGPQFKLNVAAKAMVFGGISYYATPSFGGAVYGMFHYGLKQLNSGYDYLNRIDYFMGLGVTTSFPFITGNAGVSYDINDNLAFVAENEGFTGGIIGLKIKL